MKDLLFEVGIKALVVKADQTLLFLRRKKPYQSDQATGILRLDLPGGRVNPRESIEDALKREVFEETGCNILNQRIVSAGEHFFHKGFHTIRIYFVVMVEGQVKISDEHSEALWLSIEEALSPRYQDSLEPVTRKYLESMHHTKSHTIFGI